MKKVISVRIEDKLYTKVNKTKLKKSELISKALEYYFSSDKLTTDNSINGGSDYVDFLKQTLEEQKNYIGFLQKEVENLTIMSMAKVPLLARIKMKLLKEKE